MSRRAEPSDEELLAELSVAGERVRTHTNERDEMIVAAIARGLSYRVVATAAGLSHAAVQYIVARAKD